MPKIRTIYTQKETGEKFVKIRGERVSISKRPLSVKQARRQEAALASTVGGGKTVIVRDRMGNVTQASNKVKQIAPGIVGRKPSERQLQNIVSFLAGQQTRQGARAAIATEKEQILTRKRFGNIIEQKVLEGKRVTLGEFTKSVFGRGEVDLSQLSIKDFSNIKQNISDINKITDENKKINAFNKEVERVKARNKRLIEGKPTKGIKVAGGAEIVIDNKSTLEKFSDFITKQDQKLQQKGISQKNRLEQARKTRDLLVKRAPLALKPSLIAGEIVIRAGDAGFSIAKGVTVGFGEQLGQVAAKGAFLEAAAIENIKQGQFKKFFKELTTGEAATAAANSLAILKRSQIDGKLRFNGEGVANITAAAAMALVPVAIKARGRVINGPAPKSGSAKALKEAGTVFVNKGKTSVVNVNGKVIQVSKLKGNVRLIRAEINRLAKLQRSQITKATASTSRTIPRVGSKAQPNKLFVNQRTGTVRVSDSNGLVSKEEI